MKKAANRNKSRILEVQCTDDSTVRLILLEERLELVTGYGKLIIPTSKIRKIELATRVPEEVGVKIEIAILDLARSDYKRRERATADLLGLKEKAYPALLRAARSHDLEMVRRAEQLMEKIRESVPTEKLEVRLDDVVYTEDSKMTGRITASTLKVRTTLFGGQHLQLALARQISLPNEATAAPVNALPDPGTLSNLQANIGTTYTFQVTGAAAGSSGA